MRLLFLIPVVLANPTIIEEEKTHVGAYVNSISACNFNHNTIEVICVNKDSNNLVQYNGVKELVMCDYSYCVRVDTMPNSIICSGYVWSQVSNIYNPLLPGAGQVGDARHDLQGYQLLEDGSWFLGYNIKTDSFVQNVVTTYNGTLQEAFCGVEPNTMCIKHSQNGVTTKHCSGMVGVSLVDQFTSFLIGFFCTVAFSSVLYTLARYTFSALRESTVFNLLVSPAVSLAFGIYVLLAAKNIAVKMNVYSIGIILGVAAGYIISELLLRLFDVFKRRSTVNGSVAESESMVNKEGSFVIEEEEEDEGEGGVVTIELSKTQ